jgi:pimeloyl-ACP methyl ester carboxylesterase
VAHFDVPRIRVGAREVAYDDPRAGEPGRLPVLCVHGSSFGRGTWQPCLPWIGALGPYRPLTLDQPGHGGSSGPACTSVEELGTHLAGFVAALDLRRPFALIGHSLGGAVAQWYQRAHPDDVVALGLVSTTPQFTVPPGTLDAWKAAGAEFSRDRLDAIVSPGTTSDVRARVLAARSETTLEALHGDLDAIAGWTNPDWLTIPVPTLVVTADADTPSIQEYARRWVAGLDHGTLASIPDAGHMMPIEQPEATARVIVEWLGAVVPPGRTPGSA